MLYHYRLHGTCNHVAGLLFRVECAVRMGLTSATSQLCKWNVPNNPKVTKDQPLRLSAYKWKKDHYFKHGNIVSSARTIQFVQTNVMVTVIVYSEFIIQYLFSSFVLC